MFTIKHISPMGNEMLIETEEVFYAPHAEPPTPDDGFGESSGNLWAHSKPPAQ